jgi:transcription initiation factor TFIIIB Brf1 subunit/transcription initiation factor TFIIB
MDRAWITTGRRPNGLCGSAILIAARVLGFKRSTSQIVRVAHVCEETIRKRLSEFKHTNIAQLTAAQVHKIENPSNPLMRSDSEQSIQENMDPPSFTKNLLMIEMQ